MSTRRPRQLMLTLVAQLATTICSQRESLNTSFVLHCYTHNVYASESEERSLQTGHGLCLVNPTKEPDASEALHYCISDVSARLLIATSNVLEIGSFTNREKQGQLWLVNIAPYQSCWLSCFHSSRNTSSVTTLLIIQ